MGAETTMAADPGTLMIADFEEPDVLERIGWNEGVSVSLSALTHKFGDVF